MLFVPGHKTTWVEKIHSHGADAVTLDLEDSVPAHMKIEAREIVASAIAQSGHAGTRLYARINKGRYAYDVDDLRAVVRQGLSGIFVPKADDPTDIEYLSRLISELEDARGMAVGSIGLVVPIETAGASRFVHEIADIARVEHIVAVSARGADLERNLGFNWTEDGLETLYHRSRAIIASRAAGKSYPIGGMWQEVHDLEGLRKAARFNRQLGFSGEIVLHPSQVAVVNEVYSLSADEIAYYRGMIAAFSEAEQQGKGAIMYQGEHIDIAHVETARAKLRWSEEYE